MFIGYSITQKGYKVLHLNDSSISLSRDVVFHEKYFPFHISKTSSSSLQFFLPKSKQTHIFQDPFIPYYEDYPSTIDRIVDPSTSTSSSRPPSSSTLPSPLISSADSHES